MEDGLWHHSGQTAPPNFCARRPSRRALLGAGLGLTLAASAGCSGVRAGLTPQADDAAREIDFFWYVEGNRAKYSIAAARRFQRRHHGVTVNMLHTAYAAYWDRLATETAGGNPPDVFQLELARQAEYAARNAVQPITDLMPDLITQIEPDVLQACRYDDTLYFIPTGLSTSPALVVNEAVLDKLDLTPPAAEWTQDDFSDFCHRVFDRSDGNVHGTSDLGGSHWSLQAFARSRGEDPFATNGNLTLSRDTVGDWLRWWQRLRNSKACVPMARSAESGGFENSPVVTRDAALGEAASAKGILGLQGLTKDTLNLVTFPLARSGGPAGVMIAPIEWWAISGRTEPDKAQLAAKLCSFILTDPDSVAGMTIEHGIPVVPRLRQDARASAGPVVERTFVDFDRARRANPRPVTPQPTGAGELFTQVLPKANEDVGFGRTSVSAAVRTFFDEASRVLR